MDRRTSIFIVILFAALLSFPWIGERRFYTRGEPREALVPQKMIESSNWILPRTFDDRVPSKPPFTHWMMGLSAWARSTLGGEFKIDEWSARLPAALFSVVFLLVFVAGVDFRLGTERALHAGLILLTSIEWMRGMVSTRVDTVLSVLLALGLFCIYTFIERRSVRALAGAVLALTAATLTKGPVALLLPAGLSAVFLLFEKRSVLRSLQLGVQIFLPALLLASIWYALAYQIGGDDFLAKFWYENVERFSSSTEDKPHNHTVFYLILMLLVGMLPWSLLAIGPLINFFRQTDRRTRLRTWWLQLHSFERFSLLIVIGFFIFFSIPSSKRGVYLLPSFPFAAVLLSRFTSVPNYPRMLGHILRWAALTAALIPLALLVAVLVVPELAELNELQRDLFMRQREQLLLRPLSWALLCIIAALAGLLLRRSADGSPLFVKAALLYASVLTYFQGPVVTAFADSVSEYHLAEQLRTIDPRLPLHSYHFEYYGTIFYLGRTVSLEGWAESAHGVILVRERDYHRFVEEFSGAGEQKIIARSRGSVVKVGDRVLVIEFSRNSSLL